MVQGPQSEKQRVLTLASSAERIIDSSLNFSGGLVPDDAFKEIRVVSVLRALEGFSIWK
jgi:hypothetical protein